MLTLTTPACAACIFEHYNK